MADDLDTLLRAAMKTLDEQVPSGYFEALPNQTLARLEGSMQQQGSSGTTTRDKLAPPPAAMEPDTTPVAKQESAPAEREEDSGLHDIRNLAQSTKQRLSKKSITNAPPIDNDVLASSSGSFKNIALPQPARMVSLPEIDELPSKKEVLAAEKAAEKVERSKKATKKPETVEAVPAIKTDLVAMPAAPAAAAVESHARSSFSLPSQQRKSSKGPLLAILGAGVAAAAGYVIFMQVNKGEDKSAAASQTAPAAAKADTAALAAPAAGSAAAAPAAATPPAPTVEPIPAEAPKDEAAAGAGAPAQIAADADKAEEEKAVDTKAAHHTGKATKTAPKSKVEKVQNQKEETPKPETKPAETSKLDAKKGAKAGSGDEGEPSFDALLKEAGVQDKKDTKPKLDKKSLTGDDFKQGMSSVESKAKACYKGTQGTALVKLTVGPTGKITKIAVAGDFSGKPEALCIAAALRGATFPPWDGGPQSFTYAVLLSD